MSDSIPDLNPKTEPAELPRAIVEAIRRIVRDEVRKAQLDVTAKHGYSALGSMRIVEQPFAGAMWPDEEETDA